MFFFWRIAYNVGIGGILYMQSESRYFSKKMAEMMKNGTVYAFPIVLEPNVAQVRLLS